MQSKLRISLKPWETARTANGLAAVSFDGGLSQASVPVGNPFVKIYSKTHLPKAPLSDYIEEMVVAEEDAILIERTNRGDSSPARDAMTMQELHNQSMYTSSKASAKKSLTVVEFDESLSNLWRQLRVV